LSGETQQEYIQEETQQESIKGETQQGRYDYQTRRTGRGSTYSNPTM